MAEKLKSITKLIHWSLLARVVVFILGWLYLPLWAFLVLVLYCYFMPAFHAGRLLAPFLVLLAICFAEPPGIVMAILLGAIFYYLLLVKDLLVIARASAHELLAMTLSFFLFRMFFGNLDNGPTGPALAWTFVMAFLFAMLIGNLIDRRREDLPRDALRAEPDSEAPLRLRQVAVWL